MSDVTKIACKKIKKMGLCDYKTCPIFLDNKCPEEMLKGYNMDEYNTVLDGLKSIFGGFKK